MTKVDFPERVITLKLREAVKRIEVPVIVGQCECGAKIELRPDSEHGMRAWMGGAEIQNECPTCKVKFRSRRSPLIEPSGKDLAMFGHGRELNTAMGEMMAAKVPAKVNGS